MKIDKIPLLDLRASCLFCLFFSLVSFSAYLTNLELGFNFSIAFLFLRGFFFWISWMIMFYLTGLTTDYISLELIILEISAFARTDLSSW